MRAISLWQPWASLVALGEKHIETRSWPTGYRGPIAIHASKKWTPDLIAICSNPKFLAILEEAGLPYPGSLPRGVILATAQLVDVVQFQDAAHVATLIRDHGAPREASFGDFSRGRYGWTFEQVEMLAHPAPARGQQGVWEWDPSASTVPAS